MLSYEVTLSDVSNRGIDFEQAMGADDKTLSLALITKIDQVAKLNNAKISQTIERHCTTRHYPQEIEQSVTSATYAFISAGDLAVFVSNVLGALKDWRDLSKGRTVKVRLMEKEIELAEGTDIEKFFQSAPT